MADLFKADTNVSSIPEDDNTQEDRDFVADLVGEGKKYKDLNALAKAKIFADEHIKRLEAEAEERAKELDKRLVVEEMMAEIKAMAKAPAQNTNPEPKATSTTDEQVSKDDIAKLVTSELMKLTEKQKQEQNLKQVADELTKVWGTDYSSALLRRSKELELTPEFMNQLASVNPKAFLRMVVEPVTQLPNYTPPKGIRSDTKLTGEKNYKYYQKIRKENPRLYASLQMEMFKQAEKLGDSFYN